MRLCDAESRTEDLVPILVSLADSANSRKLVCTVGGRKNRTVHSRREALQAAIKTLRKSRAQGE